jgi:4'-phosphopantetheinyl transferase
MHMAKFPSTLVQLNYASLDLLNDKSFSAQVLGWLSSEERKRYKRFVSKQQANQYLLARAVLRSQLSKRVPGVLPYEWEFVIDDSGKPRLADGFSHLNLRFNLSHSESLVVLALSEGVDLGVDVECIHRRVFNMALAKRYFAKAELADLMRLTEQQQIKRIAQLWTLKESYLKANGLGVRMPLAKLQFYFEGGDGLSVNVSPSWVQSLPAEGDSFVSLFGLGSDYSLALTIDTDQKVDASAIAIHEWTGLRGQPLGLPCELLRKTVGQNFSQKLL